MKLRFLNRLVGHRVACLALFRAILAQCNRVPLTPDQKESLRIFARKQFRKNLKLDSHRCASAALEIGYEAESILRASADGNLAETSRISKLLEELPPPGRRPPIKAAAAAKPKGATLHKPGSPYPGAAPVLSRPYRKISGRRHIPKLVILPTGIPFLRFKKPQSPFLSRVLRTKINWRQKLVDRKNRLAEEGVLASGEDLWDRLLREQHCVGQGRDANPWAEWYVKCIDSTAMVEEDSWSRDRKLAGRMQKIVDRERELAEEEKRERKRAKRRITCEAREPTGNYNGNADGARDRWGGWEGKGGARGRVQMELKEKQSVDYTAEPERSNEAHAQQLGSRNFIRTVPSAKWRITRRVKP